MAPDDSSHRKLTHCRWRQIDVLLIRQEWSPADELVREAAEEGIGLPLRARTGVGDCAQKLAQDFFVGCGGGFVDGLRKIGGWRVVAHGKPLFKDGLAGGGG